jgi:hypothetical protein
MNIKYTTLVLGAFFAALSLSACSSDGGKVVLDSKVDTSNKEISYQEAAAFAKSLSDFVEKDQGVFTASNGVMYEIITSDDGNFTVGSMIENYDQYVLQLMQKDSYEVAVSFVKEINALAAFTIALDAEDKAAEAMDDLGYGSYYYNGVFTTSAGFQFPVTFNGDTATLGEVIDDYSEMTLEEQKSRLEGYQEARIFVREINALAAFTPKFDAAEKASEAINDLGEGMSYDKGIFTASNGVQHEISIIDDTAIIVRLVTQK